MPNTLFQSLPYPAPTDPVDVAGDIQALAEAIDTKMLDKAVLNAKGDLLCGLADNTVTAVTVGANDTVLVADSSAVPGVKWSQVQTSAIADGAVTSIKLAANAAVPAGVINPFAGVNAPAGWLLCNGSDVSRSTYSALFATFGTTFLGATVTSGSKTVTGLSGMTSTMIGWGISGTNIASGATITAVSSASQVTMSINATGTASGTATVAISPYGFSGANNTTSFLLPNMTGRTPVGRDTGQTEFDILGEQGGSKTHTLSWSEMPSHSHGPGPDTQGRGIDSFANIQSQSPAFGYGGSNSATLAFRDSLTTASAGGSAAHNNLQPYIVVNYIIKT